MNTPCKTACTVVMAFMPAVMAGTPAALAESQRWTCSYDAAAGLTWKYGSWRASEFNPGAAFELIMDGDSLNEASAAKPMSTNTQFVECRQRAPAALFCADPDGGWLVFNPKTGKGGLSKIYTAIKTPPNEGSTLSVEPFTCQRS